MRKTELSIVFFTILSSLWSASVQAFITRAAVVRETPARRATHCAASSPTSEAVTRVEFLRTTGVLATTAAAAAVLPGSCRAETYVDNAIGFTFEAPEGWERGEAELSGRRKAVFYRSPKNPTANAIIVCTPVKGDYTSLGSFGSLDEVSKTVLPEGEGISSRLLDAYRQDTFYVYDYTVAQEGRPETHIKTLWLLVPQQGQLVTITAQVSEADYGEFGKAIDNLIASVKTT